MKDNRKHVNKDWLGAFPQLTRFSLNKFYKILGPVIVGIELIKPPGVLKYSPHFVIYSLWGNRAGHDLKACMSIPLLLKSFQDKNSKEIFIDFDRHDFEFHEVLKSVRKQLPLSLQGPVSQAKILEVLDGYSKSPPLSAAPNSYLQASLMQSKLELAICSGTERQVEEIFKQIVKRNWDLNHFELWGIDYKNWIKDLEKCIDNKHLLLARLEANKRNSKLAKLQRSELVDPIK